LEIRGEVEAVVAVYEGRVEWHRLSAISQISTDILTGFNCIQGVQHHLI
jgi:hypothetical protein